MPYKRAKPYQKMQSVMQYGAMKSGRKSTVSRFKKQKTSGYIAPASQRSIAMRSNIRNQPIRNSRLRWKDTVYRFSLGVAGVGQVDETPDASAAGHNWLILNAMNSGSGNSERDGNTIFNRSLILNLHMRNASENTTQGVSMRFLVFNDRKPNAVATQANNHLANLLIDNTNEGRILSPVKPEAMDRYKILHDEIYTVQPAGSCGSKLTTKLTIPLNFKSIFTGPTAADDSAMTEGALWVIWFREDDTKGAYTSPAQAGAHARIYYLP